MLTDDGPLNSPQIEPALGAIVEDPASDRPAVDILSPTNTDQSLPGNPEDGSEASPTLRGPSLNLAAELENQSMDSSEEETQTEEANQSTTRQEPSGAEPGKRPAGDSNGAAVEPNDALSGGIDELQKEIRKRLAAEARVKTLQAELKAEKQRCDDEVEAEKLRFKRAIQKANQDREADKVKFDKEFSQGDQKIKMFQAEIAKLGDNVATLEAKLESSGKSSADDAARIKLEKEQEEYRKAFEREVNPTVEAPLMTPRDYPRPGSARFLLAESAYLLDKYSPLYDAVRAAANYVDCRGDWNSKEKQLFGAFGTALGDMNDFLEKNMDRPDDCLKVAREDWGLQARENTW